MTGHTRAPGAPGDGRAPGAGAAMESARRVDVITNNVTLIDAFEKEGRMGTMLFLVDESRWTNQRDELVRIGQRTSIYY